jgi:hypothetical protein
MAQAGTTDVAMKGGGYYSLATLGATHVIEAATPLVLDAIGAAMDHAQHEFTITDMGCADGGTSLTMIRAAIDAIRTVSSDLDVRIVYTDQPRNDFNALFQILHGKTDFNSYLTDYQNIYVAASATSFYQQILSDGTLNLGFSATAMHWLSRKPGNISDHVHVVGASGEELATFSQQGRRDWEAILLHRAAELAPGGRLVLVNFARDEQGRYLGNTGGLNMFDTFNAIWQGFLDEGNISADEYRNMTLPQYYNTVQEFSAPLLEKRSPVYAAGLRLEGIETRIVPCPFAADFAIHGDSARFAREYIPTLRSWTEATFFDALDKTRAIEERHELIDRYYGEYESRVRDDPTGHAMDYVHAYMTIRKEP